MHNTTNQMSRRHFLATTGAIAGTALLNPLSDIKAETTGISAPTGKKLRIALVGTGGRGTSMWGRDILKSYPDYLECVGLCDKNEGRVETGKRIIGTSCPTYTDFEKMMNETKPDILIVTTMDSTHHQFNIRGMELGADIITEKPMTTDEKKIQAILDADKEGFLRSETSLIQTIGRAARNAEGHVIMYADVMTDSMRNAIEETNRRREIQKAYNKEHGITPKTIQKSVRDLISISKKVAAQELKMEKDPESMSRKELEKLVRDLEKQMKKAAAELNFEAAAELRDKLLELKKHLNEME